jgi:hypothetical protein
MKEITNYKHQITRKSQIPMTEITTEKNALFGIRDL